MIFKQERDDKIEDASLEEGFGEDDPGTGALADDDGGDSDVDDGSDIMYAVEEVESVGEDQSNGVRGQSTLLSVLCVVSVLTQGRIRECIKKCDANVYVMLSDCQPQFLVYISVKSFSALPSWIRIHNTL